MVVMYRLPSSSTQAFFDEFDDLLEHLVMNSGQLLIIGDFDIHIDNAECTNSRNFMDLIHSYGLDQHVNTPTHRSGHTLDLAMTLRIDPHPHVTALDLTLSDHYAIVCFIDIQTPTQTSQPITYRSLKKIDCAQFIGDIIQSSLPQRTDLITHNTDTQLYVDLYDDVLSGLLDKHAPVKTGILPSQTKSPWYTDELRLLKQERRLCERRWMKTGLQPRAKENV
ncbi:hypothetical protein CAPTEDRAFT_214477 [Capitella teleta]|uniref:Endonuclease/exonuclease/phosphatase domain-containing protein n=1 Tax=Capitella teleta TaxID=283909 RepID=R7TC04_CAPTE|nr:hypothetical protein CAPTEDRAFT_214477 [Capitella teleta]|eukprot:ELT91248.1 hypothetical protein CAPTEDRAFT_214477 [Capitella teleta]